MPRTFLGETWSQKSFLVSDKTLLARVSGREAFLSTPPSPMSPHRRAADPVAEVCV